MLGIDVAVVKGKMNANDNLLDEILHKQKALIGSGNSTSKVLNNLSTDVDVNAVAKIFGLEGDSKTKGVYRLSKNIVNRMVDGRDLLSDVKGVDNRGKTYADRTTNLRNKYNKYNSNESKIEILSRMPTYLSNNGIIKQYVKARIVGAKYDDEGKVIKGSKSENIVYIPLGTRSNKVENSSNSGYRAPLAIDRNNSGLWENGFRELDESHASSQTKTIISDYNE